MGKFKNNVQAIKCCLTNGKFALLLLSSILLLNSCGTKLSREDAEKIIKDTYHYPICDVSSFNYSIYANSKEKLKNVLENNLIELKTRQIIGAYSTEEYFISKIGEQFIVGEISPYCEQEVITNCRILDKITGIAVNEQNKTATVDFTSKIIGVTPFGNDLGLKEGDVTNHSIGMVQYDDGWRIGQTETSKPISTNPISNYKKGFIYAKNYPFFNEKGEYIGIKE